MRKTDRRNTQVDTVREFSRTHGESQIELVLVHVSPDHVEPGPWRSLEFWTANTMYGLDASRVCIEARPRKLDGPSPSHIVGASLVGSQMRDGQAFSVSFPYPVPGMEAVFRLGASDQHVTTSSVERVMLRVRITNMEMPAGEQPDWSKITAVWQP